MEDYYCSGMVTKKSAMGRKLIQHDRGGYSTSLNLGRKHRGVRRKRDQELGSVQGERDLEQINRGIRLERRGETTEPWRGGIPGTHL